MLHALSEVYQKDNKLPSLSREPASVLSRACLTLPIDSVVQ
jgi:hypothetical protein